MPSPFDPVFDEVETTYLKPDQLREIGKYVVSLPERVAAYRALRDQELRIMQQVADQLQSEGLDATEMDLERSLKNAILSVRYCAMAMLTGDESLLQNRWLNWLKESIEMNQSQAIDRVLFPLVSAQLNQTLTSKQMETFQPFWDLIQALIPAPQPEEMLTAAGIF
jgi:nucleotidyltransferase/DNA polymerase involved in DNA repair